MNAPVVPLNSLTEPPVKTNRFPLGPNTNDEGGPGKIGPVKDFTKAPVVPLYSRMLFVPELLTKRSPDTARARAGVTVTARIPAKRNEPIFIIIPYRSLLSIGAPL